MYLNGYSVRVVGGKEIPGGYVEMNHDQRYSLSLRNSNSERCDAKVEVDGRHVGTWRIPGHSTINLERPANDDGHFTFYRQGSEEGRQVDPLGNADPGLIRVTFTPEVRCRPLYREQEVFCSSMPSAAAPSWSGSTASVGHLGISESTASYTDKGRLSSGVTGLSGHSQQRFSVAEHMELDYARETVIHLRLVRRDGDSPRPLTSMSSPVPPRVR